jgi:hypothetical protein
MSTNQNYENNLLLTNYGIFMNFVLIIIKICQQQNVLIILICRHCAIEISILSYIAKSACVSVCACVCYLQ